jgi:hypothetical protein
MNIAVAYKLQQAQLWALFDKKQTTSKTLRDAKQKSTPLRVPLQVLLGDRQGFLLLGTTAGDRDYLAAPGSSRDKAGRREESVRSYLLSASFVLVCRWRIILAASSTSFGSRRSIPVSPTPHPHLVATPSAAM